MTARLSTFIRAACCSLFLIGATDLSAQETAATLVGSISDASGAVVPEVLVRATNLATNVSRESKSDGSGNYTLPFLPAGDYSVNCLDHRLSNANR